MELILFSIVCFVIVLFLYMYKEAFSDRIVYQELSFPDFPKSFGSVRVFFISDIHRRKISDKIIDKVRGKVDFVIIGGDLAEKGVPLHRIQENILKLRKLGEVFFVWGNNDYELDAHVLDALLLHLGVTILDNTSVTFESYEGDRLILLGIDDISLERDRLELALQDGGEGGFKVLVSHNPKVLEQILPEHNISFILCGHTHGGQIRILGIGPYEKGKIQKWRESIVLISNGYGTTGVPLRLGAKAETHLLTLKNSQDSSS